MATAPEAAPAPAPVEEVSAGENFEAAFARLSLDEPAPAPTPAPAEPAPAEPAPAEPAPAEPAPAEPAPAEPAPAEPAPAPAPVAPKDDDTVLQRLADLVRQPAPQPEPQQQQQPQQQRPVFSEEEASFLQQYEQDWPDVAKAEQLRRRAEYQQLVGYVFDQFQQHFQPVAAMVQQLATQTQLQQLQGAVPDYDVVREDVLNWVENQPTYLQVAYNHVINNGTVDQVSDMISRYKADVGITSQAGAPAPTPTPTPQPTPKRQATELPTATKQAAAALAPVSSKRTAVVTQTDPNDFESAFAAFSSAKSL